ncbi:neutral zinc metallopeptidase [Sphaerisporangium corydalis]|uniref:Neutral zinc metallopeptidase n=1 Tax=Sphaerisporangium corydalis TaxID=1441875 RepID=A0ABV9EB75_9ACTN|nr:neutral zinc metallopeptidase [Sphaerisporangium corydalis]
MRRLLPLLLVCAFVTACTAEPLDDPIPMSVPQQPVSPSPSPTPSPPSSRSRLAAPPSIPAPKIADGEYFLGPYGREAAVANPLYGAPKATAKCPLPAIKAGSWASMKHYMKKISSCLDRIWAREFWRTRIRFSPPRARFVQRRTEDRECGLMPSKGADGTYCDETRTYYVIVRRSELHSWAVPWIAEVIAHEYSHHLQALANISDYEWDVYDNSATRKAEDLASRRLELQAECLAGVALHAMRGELPPWWQFRETYQGTLNGQWVRDHGRLSTQLRWLEKGYHSGRPGSCDTWSPRKSAVT